MFNSFLIGLQFLTRIKISTQTVWTEEDFGKSVKFFPAVGAIVGIISATIIFLLNFLLHGNAPIFLGAAAFFLTVALTGGIHFDGLSDSADGLFSGREREKILEIMKDSRVGSFGAVALITISILNVSAVAELARVSIFWTVAGIFSAPIIGRLMMVFAIFNFPYARPEGMGKAFSKYTTRGTFFFALVESFLMLCVAIFFLHEIFFAEIFAMVGAFFATNFFCRFAIKKIGGVTGDIYGAVELIAEISTLIIFLFASRV